MPLQDDEPSTPIRKQRHWLKYAFVVSICTLALQLFWPTFNLWWELPGAGSIGKDRLTSEFKYTCLSLKYLGYLPSSYYRQTSWPVIVYLHGNGGQGYDLEKHIPTLQFLAKPNGVEQTAILLIPQCRPGCSWQTKDVKQFLEHCLNRYRADRNRAYLVGYSMGGYGAWRTAAAHPELFAAVVPIAGGGSLEDTVPLTNMPTWVFHGKQDTVVPLDESTKLIDAIREIGGSPRTTIYQDAGHGIRSRVLTSPELWEWLLQQRLGNLNETNS
ncbi:MAG: prolyl oligopeptidase family serine peptidase [Pirellulales bacterium]|nr:prolyl oligopeptidase family serine peptidase [Pirellulales bacterium]